jgi:hypothetical protein
MLIARVIVTKELVFINLENDREETALHYTNPISITVPKRNYD